MPPESSIAKTNLLLGNNPVRVLATCLLLICAASAQTTETPAKAAAAASAISFHQAMSLALQRSGLVSIARLNQLRSFAAYKEARNHYIPQLVVGSGLGYSYGFPLTLEGSAPSVVNFNSTQSLFNLSLRQSIKAAKIDWKAQSFDIQDKSNQVLLDTALTYEQLNNVGQKLTALQKAQTAAEKGEYISQQRLKEGVGSQLDLTKSQLIAARIRLRIAEAQGQQDVLREHLASLTGMTPAEIAIQGDTIPELPLISQDDDYSARAAQNSPAVHLAEQKAAAADANAKAEHRGTLPFADLASQYAYLARFNNYDQYFLKYTPNNAAVGLNLKWPFLNYVQKARAQGADADAMIAHKQADLTKNQVSENALKLQRSIRQLQAALDVAKLDWQVSQGELEAIGPRLQTGTATLRDQQSADLEMNEKYAAYLDSKFLLTQAELQLLRISGELENWAIPTQ